MTAMKRRRPPGRAPQGQGKKTEEIRDAQDTLGNAEILRTNPEPDETPDMDTIGMVNDVGMSGQKVMGQADKGPPPSRRRR